MNNDLKCLFITSDGTIIQNSNDYIFGSAYGYHIQEQSWYDELLANGLYIEYNGKKLFCGNSVEPSIAIYYVVHNIYNFDLLGYYVINLEYSQFDFLRESVSQNINLVVTDEVDKIVFTNIEETSMEKIRENQNILAKSTPGEILDEKGYLIYYDTLLDGHWNIWLIKRKMSFFEIASMYLPTFIILIPAAVVLLSISLFFIKYLMVPIVQCTNAMNKIKHNEFGITIENKYKDEIGRMIDGFNEMSKQLLYLIEKNRLMNKLKRDAEIKVLQQQINPHFLFNTLEMMNGMILTGEEMQAVKLGEMLGRLYQYGIANEKFVTVKKEISYIKSYLNIIQLKNRSITVFYEIDENAMDILILKFILQPIVENCIKHGFRNKKAFL